MNVRTQLSIVIRKRADAFARRIAKALIVNTVCRIHTDGNIKKDASYAIVIIRDRLVNRVICIRANVCAVKDLLGVNVIDVQAATLDISIVNVAIVIAMAQ